MSLLISTFLDILRPEIGQREIGSTNTGRRVQEYQAATTLDGTGWPWCAALTAWGLKETGEELKIEVPWTYSASCDEVWKDAKKRNLIRHKPERGDIFLVRARLKNGKFSNTDAIHTGAVEEVAINGKTWETIEGNSNDEGSREGYEVAANTRPVSERFVFVRWADGIKNFDVKALAPESAPVAWQVILRDQKRQVPLEAVAFDGRPYISARDFGEFYGLPVIWRPRDLQAVIAGQEVPFQVRFWKKRAFYPARVLGEMMGYAVVPDAAARKVVMSR